ncbi:glutamyl-tRNA reductase [Sinanaerobacter sp. ZZT-01]|uniref:glutamyl-tRNA reductase n=1 Tax=Sinanaerobacter sp. ZZT-01 TaxID=3111540 RepID=UPI002D776B68|nr:glutamyl-tRNA reductase [Sinanaerobacter sp. ZZT-01]WRR94670.1 glutamyl-tRNA reductase [Sinanaerobacter sp. ZZT-01]
MQITMIGIDHSKASIAYRELFSFTKAGAMEAMKYMKEKFELSGCVLLSTCNRTELWISSGEKAHIPPYEMLCEVKKINRKQYGEFFVEREGKEAVDHLLRLTCGLNSKIFGEDQIISQVREALALSRKCGCEDMVLEKVFQTAIAAAKKVKSTVRLTAVDQSIAYKGVQLLKEELGGLKGVRCLIIGNGQMGKLIANALTSHGADVTMTLRKRMHGQEEQGSIVPEHCSMLPYEERHSALEESKVVISATLSPHFTLKKEEVQSVLSEEKKRVWMDLAVPRDIDPTLNHTFGISIYDIDTMGQTACDSENDLQVKEALNILNQYAECVARWFAFRKQVPQVKRITALAAEDTKCRIGEPIETLVLDQKDGKELTKAIEAAAEKSVGKLLYGLRDTLSPDLWQTCMNALEDAAKKDTLKTGSRKDRYEGKRK